MRRYGRWRGAALAAIAYGGVHVVTGNFTLMGAAGVAGAHWCALYAAGVPLGALIVSHTTWDIWIFLVQPTGEIDAIDGEGRITRLDLAAVDGLSRAPCSAERPLIRMVVGSRDAPDRRAQPIGEMCPGDPAPSDHSRWGWNCQRMARTRATHATERRGRVMNG